MNNEFLSLNGLWSAVTDQENALLYKEAVNKLNSTNQTLAVPGNWNAVGLDNFIGTVWYKKSFLLENKSDLLLYALRFAGVDYFADVWLNGEVVGKHEGYFQWFEFDVSDLLIAGENELIVKVCSPFEEPGKVWPDRKQLIKGIFGHHDCRPGSSSSKYGQDFNTGGIWNNVELIITDGLYVPSAKITSVLNDDTASLTVQINFQSKFVLPARKIIIKITSPSGKVLTIHRELTVPKGTSEATITAEIKKPALWWSHDVGSSPLYKIQILDKSTELWSDRFGIRDVRLDEHQAFHLNRKRLFLRGTNIIPEQFLCTLAGERIKMMMKLMKDANINIVRVHAHVNRKEFYDACDEAGILVWQDFALQWTYDTSPEFAENAVSQIGDMVEQFFNHPSIAVWCCHNEPGEQINTLDKLLFNTVHLKDTSRIVRQASNYEEHAYDGWYWGDKEHYAATPMGPLVTEFGAQGLPNVASLKKIIPAEALFPPDYKVWKYHNFQTDQTFNIAGIKTGENIGEFVKNSQEYQASLLKTAIHFYRWERYTKINAVFQFMLIDCWKSISWSVVDYFGVPKQGYLALKDAFDPLLLSARFRQNKYYPGLRLNLDVYIINDLFKDFSDCTLVFTLDRKVLHKMTIDEIKADSLLLFRFDELQIWLPQKMKEGKHSLTIELFDKDAEQLRSVELEIIAENEK